MVRKRFYLPIVALLLLWILLYILPYGGIGEAADIEFFSAYTLPDNAVPVFYRNEYDITLFGIENLHPFDSEKSQLS